MQSNTHLFITLNVVNTYLNKADNKTTMIIPCFRNWPRRTSPNLLSQPVSWCLGFTSSILSKKSHLQATFSGIDCSAKHLQKLRINPSFHMNVSLYVREMKTNLQRPWDHLWDSRFLVFFQWPENPKVKLKWIFKGVGLGFKEGSV